MKLDLGSGSRPMPGFLGVDSKPGLTDFTVNLTDGRPWPFESDSVEELWSSHFIEHVPAEEVPVWVEVERDSVPRHLSHQAGGRCWAPSERRRDALFHVFSEAFRIAKPGATFTVFWPCVTSRKTYRDPTHRRFIDTEFVYYLSREGRKALGIEDYDVECNWVGTASDVVDARGDEARSVDELREQCRREWNVADQSMMRVVAVK